MDFTRLRVCVTHLTEEGEEKEDRGRFGGEIHFTETQTAEDGKERKKEIK